MEGTTRDAAGGGHTPPPAAGRSTPHITDRDFTLHVGDVTDVLATMPDESVHCVVTSPPYWGLRDYGTGEWEGGDEGCTHLAPATGGNEKQGPNKGQNGGNAGPFRVVCGLCGARRVDRQFGLEATPDEYVARMVAVFREVRRVLRSDGTCWLNIGDSYNSANGGNNVNLRTEQFGAGNERGKKVDDAANVRALGKLKGDIPGLKPKDLCGIPWRLAFALQADGLVPARRHHLEQAEPDA
jgi:hypothetical protein